MKRKAFTMRLLETNWDFLKSKNWNLKIFVSSLQIQIRTRITDPSAAHSHAQYKAVNCTTPNAHAPMINLMTLNESVNKVMKNNNWTIINRVFDYVMRIHRIISADFDLCLVRLVDCLWWIEVEWTLMYNSHRTLNVSHCMTIRMFLTKCITDPQNADEKYERPVYNFETIR